MYWDTFKYPQVTKAIQNPNNLTAFAYLYYFAPYINPTSNNAITFYVKQGSERKKIIIRPTIRTGITIELK
ncbi:pDZ domain-containing protein [Parabacteroides sp. CAG:409]|nr:pDZ domain-containing protein [Parabacteroides sp. CAG:409]